MAFSNLYFDHLTNKILAPGEAMLPHITTGSIEAPYGILVPVCPGNGLDPKEPLSEQEKEMGSRILQLLQDRRLRTRYREAAIKRAPELSLEKSAAKWREFLERI